MTYLVIFVFQAIFLYFFQIEKVAYFIKDQYLQNRVLYAVIQIAKQVSPQKPMFIALITTSSKRLLYHFTQ